MLLNLRLTCSLVLINLIRCSLPDVNHLTLDFHEEFDGSSLDFSRWEVEVNCWGGGNLEQQCYVNHPDVLTFADSKLTIKPKVLTNGYQLTESDGCNSKLPNACKGQLPVKSARIHTLKTFKFGRFEMKAQLPIGRYLWPTLWLLPSDEKYGNGWPSGGEIDILEMKGSQPDQVEFTLHHGGPFPNNLYTVFPYSNPNLKEGYHTFTMDYLKDGFRYYIDGNLIHSVNATERDWNHPNLPNFYKRRGEPWIDQQFYLILNLAVGGNYFGSGWKFDPVEDPKSWSQDFKVDYIKVYQ